MNEHLIPPPVSSPPPPPPPPGGARLSAVDAHVERAIGRREGRAAAAADIRARAARYEGKQFRHFEMCARIAADGQEAVPDTRQDTARDARVRAQVAEEIAAAIETHHAVEDLTAIQSARIARHHATQHDAPAEPVQDGPEVGGGTPDSYPDMPERLAEFGTTLTEDERRGWLEADKARRGWDPSSPQQVVIRTAIAWRMSLDAGQPAPDAARALVEAVDELPHIGETGEASGA